MTPRRVMGAAILLLVVGGVAACGDDDDSDASSTTTEASSDSATDGGADDATDDTEPDAGPSDGGLRDQYVDAIVAIGSEDDLEGFTEEDRVCVAEAFVDSFGAEEIQAAGIAVEDIAEYGAPGELGLDFSDDQADAFYDQLTSCLDLRELLIEGALGGELSPEAADCINENLTDDLLKSFFVTGFTQGDEGFDANPELQEAINTALEPCMAMDDQ